MLTTVCGWLGAAVGGLLGLVVGLLWSTFHAFVDGSRTACVATGGCDVNMDERQLEGLMFITGVAYFLCLVVGIPLLVALTLDCVVYVRTRRTMEPPPPPSPRKSRRGHPE